MLRSETIKFLALLKHHNNKTWFDAHKEHYLAAKEDFEEWVKRIIEEFGKTDPDIANLQFKNCIFRIYRDVRFRKDKTPYKTHFAARFARGGKEVHFPCYYMHIEPGGFSAFGGGIWRPAAEELKKVRQEIDYNFDEFESILQDRNFKRLFGQLEQDDKLSRVPQGYDQDDPAIEYLRLKSFFVETNVEDDVLTSKQFLRKVISAFTTVKPLVDFLSRSLD